MRKKRMMRAAALLCALLMAVGCAAAAAEIVIPDLTIPSREIPETEGLALIRDMKAGWNLGNAFDAVNCPWLRDPMDYESVWCREKTTEALIEAVHAAGFRTLRIPVSWHNHVDASYTIDPRWLDRVYEVASWARDRGMYVILNIHHDNEPGFYYPSQAQAKTSEAYVRAIWSQLAEKFASWDERLIFECVNEPRLSGTQYEWWYDPRYSECRKAMERIVYLNQVFVDTVRASGGNNANRYLMVPAYAANWSYSCDDTFSLPKDSAKDRIILSVHAYIPYDFALEEPGISSFSLANEGQKEEITWMLDSLYDRYVSRGIPVLMGEFGAMEKDGNLQARVDWLAWYVANARARGITCCWWDNHIFKGNGEHFGLFDRKTAVCEIPELAETFMRYCE